MSIIYIKILKLSLSYYCLNREKLSKGIWEKIINNLKIKKFLIKRKKNISKKGSCTLISLLFLVQYTSTDF